MPLPQVVVYTTHFNENNLNFENLWEDDISMCPFCGVIGELIEILQYESHVSCVRCMLWCCYCFSRGIVLENTMKFYSEEEMFEKFPREKIEDIIKHKTDITGTEKFVVFNLAKILKISNYDLYKYQITDNIDYTDYIDHITLKNIIPIINLYAQFNSNDARKLIEYQNSKKNNMYDGFKSIQDTNMYLYKIDEEKQKFMDRYHIITTDEMYLCNHKLFWRMAIDVNSYNCKEPIIPYPKNFNMGNDGRSIYLLYLNENSQQLYLNYWEG